jgi:hypothetical protein
MAKKSYFTEQEIEEIRRQSMQFWDESTQQMSGFFGMITDCDRMYHVKLPKELEAQYDKKPDRSCLVPPDIHNNIRSVRAQIQDLIFGTKPYATVNKVGQPNLRDGQTDKAEVLLSALIDMSGFKKEADMVNQQTFIGGIGCAATVWHDHYGRTVIRDEADMPVLDKNGALTWKVSKITSYPKMIGIGIRRVRIDPKAATKDDIRIIGYHVKESFSDLMIWKDDPDSSINFDEEKLKQSAFPHQKYYEFVTEETPLKNKPDKSVYGDDPVEIIEIRGNYKLRGKLLDLIVKIANRQIVIEARPNNLPVAGWKVFDFSSCDAEIDTIFTMGLVEPSTDLFLEMAIKRNQAIDAINRQTYDMYIGDSMATADLPDQIEYVGGRILKVNLAACGSENVTSIFAPLPRVANPIDAFMQAESLKPEIQQTMRRNDFTQGSEPGRKETATAVNALESGGFRDMKQLVGFLTESYMFKVWEKYLIYWDFFRGGEEFPLTSYDKSQITLRPGDLSFPFALNIDISAALDRPNAVRRVIESLPFAANNSYVDQYTLWENWAFFTQQPNADRLVPPPEKLMADIERENIALRAGVTLPVHPLDQHEMHLESHMRSAQQDAQDPEFDMSPEAIQAISLHIQQHQQFISQARNPMGINTKTNNGATPGQTIGGSGANMPGMTGTTPG